MYQIQHKNLIMNKYNRHIYYYILTRLYKYQKTWKYIVNKGSHLYQDNEMNLNWLKGQMFQIVY